jgi:hypothetical protein
MHTPQPKKYPNLSVVRGGLSSFRGRRRGRRVKTAAELVLDREIRAAFATLEDANGNVPSEAIYKIRQGVQLPLGVFGRRIVEAHAAGCDHGQVRSIGQRIVDWIDALYQTGGETVTERIYFQGAA